MTDVVDLIEVIGAREPDAARARASLLAAVERLSGSGSWAWESRSGRLVWSENMFRIFGLEPRAEAPTISDLVAALHPVDRRRVQAVFDAVARGEPRPAELIYRIVRPDGTVRRIHSTVVVELSREGDRLLVGWMRDLTEPEQLEQQVAAHAAVGRALDAWDGIESGGARLLEGLAAALDFTHGALWFRAGEVLIPRAAWRIDDPKGYAAEIAAVRLRAGEGIAGRAWAARAPVGVGRLSEDVTYRFHDRAARDGLRGAAGFPLIDGDEVLGAISLSGWAERELSDRLRDALAGFGHEIGSFLARHRTEFEPGILSAREIEVLKLASEGCSGPQIAARLQLSPATVKSHFENIYAKYNVPDRVAAVAKALRQGLIR